MDKSVPAATAADGSAVPVDAHLVPDLRTPLRADAFTLSEEEKVAGIAEHFREIMLLLGLDLNDVRARVVSWS
jgi:GTP cyclohydrolase I